MYAGVMVYSPLGKFTELDSRKSIPTVVSLDQRLRDWVYISSRYHRMTCIYPNVRGKLPN